MVDIQLRNRDNSKLPTRDDGYLKDSIRDVVHWLEQNGKQVSVTYEHNIHGKFDIKHLLVTSPASFYHVLNRMIPRVSIPGVIVPDQAYL